MIQINRTRLLQWYYSPRKKHKGYTWKLISQDPIKLAGFENYEMILIRFAYFLPDGRLWKTQGIAMDASKKDKTLDDLAISLLELAILDHEENWTDDLV